MKKIIIIVLLVSAVAGLLYYGNITFISSENKKTQEQLQSRINELTADKQRLENKIAEAEKAQETENDTKKGSLELTDVQIQSNEIYTDGTVKGAIYGAFNVVARVRNISNAEIPNVKVTALLVKSSPTYATVGVDSKAQKIDKLAPGEEKMVTFAGFRVDHPETQQEVVVNVFHPFIGDINDTSNVKKINLRVAFPPGSQD